MIARRRLPHARSAAGQGFLHILLELRVHTEPGFFGGLDLGVRVGKAAGLEIDDGEVVVPLTELAVDRNRGLPLRLRGVAVAVAEVGAAEREQDLGWRPVAGGE